MNEIVLITKRIIYNAYSFTCSERFKIVNTC